MKKSINPNVQFPMPVAVVGTMFQGLPNYSTVAWISRVNVSPPMIGFGISKSSMTARAVLLQKEFSVNFPSMNQMREVDFVGMVSQKNVDKSDVFKFNFGELEKAPFIRDAPISMACKLVERIELPSNLWIVGEIVDAQCAEEFLVNGVPDYVKMKSYMITMPDNTYHAIGKDLGKAWTVKRL